MSFVPLIDSDEIQSVNRAFSLFRPLTPLINRFLKLNQINAAYLEFSELYAQGVLGEANFFVAALRYFGVNYEVSQEDLSKIPKTGPLMVVANHPFGGVDGLILGAILTQARPDVRFLANRFLERISLMKPSIIGVDVFGGKGSERSNVKSMKQALNWLQSDGCVVTFPGGTVSYFSFHTMMVVDPQWSVHVCSLAQRSKAQVLPLFFPGRNSLSFQMAGLMHPLLRTAMIGREFLRMKGKTLHVRIGRAISPRKLSEIDDRVAATRLLRLSTYILCDREQSAPEREKIRRFPLALSKKKTVHQPIVPAVDKRILTKEIASLSPDSLLLEHGVFQVYVSGAESIPGILHEIGRLREHTFREIGEGTGNPIDLDEFDEYYLHLFIWNHVTFEVVGSYRMGLTDEILAKKGKKGLYITTLFKLKDEFLALLNPAIELGRSFVRVEYQRKHATLSLLWKGIGAFIGRNPKYGRLIGPVSITDQYSAISKNLMVQFLRERKSDPVLSKLVKARKPHRSSRLRALLHESMRDSARTVDDVSALISEIEADHKGIPVLLKHYLRLNGVMLSFNRDPKFSDVVDGLILVDLEQADSSILRKHIGEDAWKAFNAYCEKNQTQ